MYRATRPVWTDYSTLYFDDDDEAFVPQQRKKKVLDAKAVPVDLRYRYPATPQKPTRKDQFIQSLVTRYDLDRIPWKDLEESVQDNILTECVTHYPNANKTHCRSCNSQSIHHIDREGMNVASTCLVIRNRGNPLDSDRVKKLCSKASSVLLSERNVDRDAAMTKELAQQKEETRKQVAENDRLKRENDYLRCQLTHVLRIMKKREENREQCPMRRDPFASPAPEVKTESYFEREPPTPLYPRLPTVREQKEVPARNRYVAEEFYEEEDEDEESGAESQEEEEEEIPVSDPLAATKQFLRANYSRDDIKDMKTNQIRSLADAHQDLFPKKGDNKFNRGIGGRYGTDLEQMKREMVRRIWDR